MNGRHTHDEKLIESIMEKDTKLPRRDKPTDVLEVMAGKEQNMKPNDKRKES